MKNKFLNYILFAVSLAFVAFVAFEVFKSFEDTKNVNAGPQFLQSKLSSVEGLEIRAGRQTTKLISENSKWFLDLPTRPEADSALLTTILQDIAKSKTESLPLDEASDTLPKYGLDDPLAEVIFHQSGGHKIKLSLSPNKAFNEDHYLKAVETASNQSFILVSDYNWLDLVLRKPSSFLKRQNVVNLKSEDLSKVDVKYTFLNSMKRKPKNVFEQITFSKNGSGVKSEVKQNDNNLWTVDFKPQSEDSSPSSMKKIDPASVSTLLRMLESLKINTYEEDPFVLKKPSVARKYLQLEFYDKNNKPQSLIFFDKFKSCDVEGHNEECQLLTYSDSVFPFWVDKSELKSLVEQKYLK